MILNKTLYHASGYFLAFVKGLLMSFWAMVKNIHRLPSKYSFANFDTDNYSLRFRGLPYLVPRDDEGPRCNACLLCSQACPSQCLTIIPSQNKNSSGEKYPKEFKFEVLKCTFCGLCVEACPVDAIRLSRKHQLSSYAEIPWSWEGKDLIYFSGEKNYSPSAQKQKID
ncbi:MAG: 4Fe-4S binding protein [Pseudomonadota bacterium]